MTNLDTLWNETEPGTTDFAPIKPGSYRAKVTGALYEQGKDGKPDRVQFEYTLNEVGEFENRKVWENNQITEQGIKFLVTNLDKLGIEKPAKLADLPQVLEGALDKDVKIKVTNKQKQDGSGVWVNAFIQEQVDPEDVAF